MIEIPLNEADRELCGFGGALLLEMERVGLAHATDAESGHA